MDGDEIDRVLDQEPYRVRYYDRQGREMTLQEWSEKLMDFSYKIVARAHLGENHEVMVSTVWLGLDHSFRMLTPDAPPVIFETMIFGLDTADGEYQWRYATEEQALEGHAHAVTIAKTALDLLSPGGAPEPDPTRIDEKGAP